MPAYARIKPLGEGNRYEVEKGFESLMIWAVICILAMISLKKLTK
jgi:hypothetical protein